MSAVRMVWLSGGLLALSLGCGDDAVGSGTDAGTTTGMEGTTTGATTSDGSTSSSTGGSSDSSTGAETSSGESSSSNGETSSSSSGGPVGSAGCGNATRDPTETFVSKMIDVGGTEREYFVWLPQNYDPDRPYPVVYQHHGCGGNPNNVPPVQEQSGDSAIHVRGFGSGADGCWDTDPDGADLPYFDAVVAEMDATYCTNPERRFALGYSSGGFMSHRLACSRGDMLRGVGSIAGATPLNECVGEVAAVLIHDSGDGFVDIALSETTRDDHLEANGCSQRTTPWVGEPCVAYEGCDDGLPVVWCPTMGNGHGRQDGFSDLVFWTFFEGLL